jgi:hypothetical protein
MRRQIRVTKALEVEGFRQPKTTIIIVTLRITQRFDGLDNTLFENQNGPVKLKEEG